MVKIMDSTMEMPDNAKNKTKQNKNRKQTNKKQKLFFPLVTLNSQENHWEAESGGKGLPGPSNHLADT